jgi:hypothetical protein
MVAEIIDDCWVFELSVKSKEDEVELSTERINDVIMQCDINLIKSSIEEFLL